MGKIMKDGECYSGWGSPGGGGGSTVSVTQIQTTGTKIATITVDNVDTDLYAPNGGGGGSGTIEGDATVKWAGKSLSSAPSTYPYKQTREITATAASGNKTVIGTYQIDDGSYTNINVTFDVDYSLASGTDTTININHAYGITDSRHTGGFSISLTDNGTTCDNPSVTSISGTLQNAQVSGSDLYAFYPSSIEVVYNGNTISAHYTGGILRTQLAASVATTTTTYDVMEAFGISLVVNGSDFSAITSSKVVDKLKCTFENARYYIQNIQAVKLNDGTTSSINITAGAGILYFDNFEYIDMTSTTYAYGQGTLRVVVPNSGGEWLFNGVIGIGVVTNNSISVILGRGTLTKSDGTAYMTTGNASAFTINTTTSSVSSVYMELI